MTAARPGSATGRPYRDSDFYARATTRPRSVPFNDTLARGGAHQAPHGSSAQTRSRGEQVGDGRPAVVARPGKRPARRCLLARPRRRAARPCAFVRDRVLVAGERCAPDRAVRRRTWWRRGSRAASSASSGPPDEVAAGRFIEPASRRLRGRARPAHARRSTRCSSSCASVDVARKEFIATASHELRTPIFSLGGFVELLQDEELDEETRREFLETMSEQVARLQKLSVDLLDLSRLDAGLGRAAHRAGGPGRARSLGCRRVHARRSTSTAPSSTCGCRTRARRPPATVSGWPRSCGSCSTTRFATRRRART